MLWLVVAVAVFALLTIKTLPFAYFARFYLQVLVTVYLPMVRFFRNGKQNTFGFTKPADVFSWVPYHLYVLPLEIDMYLHKLNLTYFADLDIARTKLVCQIMQRMFIRFRNNDTGEFKGKLVKNFPFVPVALIKGLFKREMLVFSRFQIKSRFFGWDDNKWVYVVSKFVTGSGKNEKVMGIFVTKYCFKKKGRITIRPREILQESGFFTEEVYQQGLKQGEIAWTDDWDTLCKIADATD